MERTTDRDRRTGSRGDHRGGRDHDHGHDRNRHSDHDHSHDRDSDHDHEGVSSVTDRVHENSWSANLELPRHAGDRDLTVSEAVEAVEHTAAGYHVNLVTHGDNGHPEDYLFEGLAAAFGDDVAWEYVEQCGCGGHVTRVHVGETSN